MSLFRIILLFLIGYFLWRIVRTATRMMSNRRPRGVDDGFPSEPGRTTTRTGPYREIKDADFEDITHKKEKDQSPPAGQQ